MTVAYVPSISGVPAITTYLTPQTVVLFLFGGMRYAVVESHNRVFILFLDSPNRPHGLGEKLRQNLP